jgi:hypothetical protein
MQDVHRELVRVESQCQAQIAAAVETEKKQYMITLEKLKDENSSIRNEVLVKQAEIFALKETISNQQDRLVRMSESESVNHYEDTIADLIQRLMHEKERQDQMEEMTHSLNDEISKLRELHRNSNGRPQSQWQNRRTIKAEKLEIRSLLQER